MVSAAIRQDSRLMMMMMMMMRESFPTAPSSTVFFFFHPPVKVSIPLWYACTHLPAGTALLALPQCQCGANRSLKLDSADCGSDLLL